MPKRGGLTGSLQEFLFQLRKYKLGSLGLVLIVAFISVAVFAPVIAQNDPNAMGLADSWAVPVWMKVFSEYGNLPPDVILDTDWDKWTESGSTPDIGITAAENLTISLRSEESQGRIDSQTLEFIRQFEYVYDRPTRFTINLPYEVHILSSGSTSFGLKIYLVDTEDRKWDLYSRSSSQDYSQWNPPLVIDSRNYFLKFRLGLSAYDNPAKEIFDAQGVYKIIVEIKVSEYTSEAQGESQLVLGDFYFRIPGKVYGLLGTDNFGGDLFAQLVYGTRVSLLVGVLSAVISISIGTVVGVIAGFKGGIVDQLLMYFTDTLIFLPLIPLLIALSVFFGKNLYFMIILIASLNWMGLARQSRAFVMSLRDSMFVEAERAIGASEIYIVFRHIIPQLAPLIYVGIIFRVPGAVLLEAALSFLGLGDPSISSWGKMLYNARYAGAFGRLAWWWLVPPGLCITLLAIAFVFMGHSLDEILNPRLKVRR